MKECWAKDPSKRPMASEILKTFDQNPYLIGPSVDVPMALGSSCTDHSSDKNFNSTKLSDHSLLSSEQSNFCNESYSPMAGISVNNPISLDNDMINSNAEDTNVDKNTVTEPNSPFLPSKLSCDPELISSYVQAGYINCKDWKLSSSVYSSSGSL